MIGSQVDWTSTAPVDIVIVKGGEKANLYSYASGTLGDTGLSAPIGKYGHPKRISWVEYGANPLTPPPGTGTTPSGAILPEAVDSGNARLRGPSGCVRSRPSTPA